MRAQVISFVLTLMSRLSLRQAQGLGRLLGWLFYRFPNKEKVIAGINIASCLPDLSASEQAQLVRTSLGENAKTLAEMPGIWAGRYRDCSEQVEIGEGAELYQAALAEGRGVIAVGPHQGNWEVGLHYLSTLGPVTSPYRAPKMAFLDERIKSGRGQGGATLVEATPSGVKALLSALKRGEMVALLADQQPKAAAGQGAVFAPFFGHPALTGVLTCRLAQKTRAPVLFWYMQRLPKGAGFKMHWFEAPSAIYDRNSEAAAEALNQGLERCIRHRPEQFLWTYKRFDRRPENETSPYKLNSPLSH